MENLERLHPAGSRPWPLAVEWLFSPVRISQKNLSPLIQAIVRAFCAVSQTLTRQQPSKAAQWWRQPLFGNTLIQDNQGCTKGFAEEKGLHNWAKSSHNCVGAVWNFEVNEWKKHADIAHLLNPQLRRERGQLLHSALIRDIPWDPARRSTCGQDNGWETP